MKITIEQRAHDCHAHINDDRRLWAAGKSADEAIGNLIRTHASQFGITIDLMGTIIGAVPDVSVPDVSA